MTSDDTETDHDETHRDQPHAGDETVSRTRYPTDLSGRDQSHVGDGTISERRRNIMKYAAAGSVIALSGVPIVGSADAKETRLDRSNWTVSASSTYRDVGYDPSNAIDGQNATHWRPNDGADEWIETDLGAPKSFYKIEMVAPRSETDDNPLFNQWPDAYEVQVRSDTNKQWRTVATTSGNSHTESVRFST